MPAIARSSQGAVINHHNVNSIPVQYKNNAKEHKATESNFVVYKWRSELFAVYTPFYMDSQAARLQKHQEMPTEENSRVHTNPEAVKETSADKKRKKKRKRKLCQNEEESKLSNDLKTALPVLVAQAKENDILSEASLDIIMNSNNNKEARETAAMLGCGDLFQDLCEDSKTVLDDIERNIYLQHEPSLTFSPSFIINKCVHNESDSGLVLTVGKHKFLIPPHSRFLTSDLSFLLSHLYENLKVDDGYDVIVLDPPWTNKSVKRMKSYQSILETELCALPIKDLTKPGSIIIVWVTNNVRIDTFIKENIFPRWNVGHIGDWIWMKVTAFGVPVLDLDSHHKKPYEKIIIGKVLSSDKSETVASSSVQENGPRSSFSAFADESSPSTQGLDSVVGADSHECHQPSLPKDFVLLSVPCALHSKKPSLKDVLEAYLPPSPKCLELFARNLVSGWTCWGNEPLRHQHVDLFEESLDEGA